MPKDDVSDETLMAYADGQLDARETAALRARLAVDPPLRERLSAFLSTRDLGPLFCDAMVRTVPESLRAALSAPIGTEGKRMAAAPSGEKATGLLRALTGFFNPGRSAWALGIALSTCLIVGSVGGWMAARLDGQGGTLMAAGKDGTLVAGPLLASVLETGLSVDPTNPIELKDSAATVTVSTFMAADGRPCRQYRVVLAERKQGHAGVACREGAGRWTIEGDAMAPTQKGLKPREVRFATGPLLDSVVEGLAKGESLNRDQERDLIAEGWRKPPVK